VPVLQGKTGTITMQNKHNYKAIILLSFFTWTIFTK